MNGPQQPHAVGVLVKVFPKLTETFVLEEVLGLERLGVPLRVYTLAAPTDRVTHAAVAQVRAPVVQLPLSLRDDALRTARRHLRLAVSSPWHYARALLAALRRGRGGLRDFVRAGWLAGQLRRDGVAHLHAHFISAPADVAELVSALSGLPFSISAHAKDIYLSRSDDLRRKLEAARFTVTCTDFNCRTLRRVAPEAPIHRMYHGIDASVFHPARRAVPSLVPLLLSVGRLREKKGLDTLVRACRVLNRRGVPFRCEIVGYGEEHDRLAELIDQLGLADQVQLTGKLAREQVIERYARAAVYVQPSRVAADGDRDGIPNVLLEAMAMGLPVVATRVSGIPEVVRDGDNGLLVGAEDVDALADAAQRLIEDPALGAQLGREARRTVTQHFDNDRNLRVVLGLLEAQHAHDAPCALA
ncbi:glycosyltransferase [uncultured Piscinibacter sp.]|uniref:glycosyltransferase n=1 Tax=uncultured Piscinibacter sp. TaxID=1131835 RepID=UPI00263A148D|nr:glycosyltransferase [uncultured Piscinibacter sp.]